MAGRSGLTRALALALSSTCGCGGGPAPVEVPAGVDLVGSVWLDVDGVITRSGPLVEVGAAPSQVEGDDDAVLLGFSAEGISVPPASVLAAGPLVPASTCEVALPEPAWSRPASGLPEELTLTTAWRRAQCPDLQARVESVELDCDTLTGYTEFTLSQVGCEVDFVMEVRPDDRVSGSVLDDGAFCSSGETGVCKPAPAERGLSALDCTFDGRGCHLELHPPAPRLEVDIEVIRVLDGVPPKIVRAQGATPRDPTYSEAAAGYLTDLVWRAPRLFVVGWGDGVDRSPSSTHTEPTTLFSVDVETGQVTGSSTAPPGLVRLAPDPDGSGFFGTRFYDGDLGLVRLDAEGRVVAEGAPLGLDLFFTYYVRDLVAAPAVSALVVVLELEWEPGGLIAVVDAETLTLRGSLEIGPSSDLREGAMVSDRVMALSDTRRDAVHFIDLETLEVESVSFVQAVSPSIGGLYVHPGTGRLLVMVANESGGLYAIAGRRPLGGAGAFVFSASPYAVALHPADPSRLLVNLVSFRGIGANAPDDLLDERLGAYEVDGERMSAAWTTSGERLGPAGRAVSAGDAAVFLHGWTASLSVVRAAE